MSKVKVYEYMVGMQGTFVNMANGHRAQTGPYVAYGDYLILLAERDGLQETADMRLEQLQTHIKRIAVVNRENDLLKAQIEETKQRWPNYHVDALIKAEAENARLQAEVERLRKAGDAMAEWMDILGAPRAVPFIEAWNAAKEGKPIK